jgi:ligand-binding sensor domain-containing protein
MASSLFQTAWKALSSQQSNFISQLAAVIKGDPQRAMAGILQQNPEMQNTLNTLVQGRDPKQVFYQKCNEMGYNPEDILKLIR